MSIKNTFDKATFEANLARLSKLDVNTSAKWGKMDVSQMLAHINVAYDKVYGNHKNVTGFKKFMLKSIVKKIVVNDKPFSKNGRTSPEFLIQESRDFDTEMSLLKGYLQKTFELGSSHFEGKENISFGVLTAKEWSNSFQKHLNHHFEQFGV